MELYRADKVDVSEDGKQVTITFDADEGSVPIIVQITALNEIMSFLGRVLVQVRAHFGGPKVMSARPARSYLADANHDRRVVLIEVTGQDGVAERFAFDPRDAKAFQERIAKAVQDCGL